MILRGAQLSRANEADEALCVVRCVVQIECARALVIGSVQLCFPALEKKGSPMIENLAGSSAEVFI